MHWYSMPLPWQCFNIIAGFLLSNNLVLLVVFAWVFSFVSISTGRFLIRRAIYRLRSGGLFQSAAVIIGENTEAKLVADQLLNARSGGLRVVGYVRCREGTRHIIGELSCLGYIDNLKDIIQRNNIRVLILISSALTQDQIISIFQRYGTSKDIDLRMSSGLYEIFKPGVQAKEDGSTPLVAINKVRLTGVDLILKTILDYCLVVPALILFSPFFLIIAILIKLDSRGPVIYLRRVLGANGKQFNAFKFRTMRKDSDEVLASHPEWLEEQKDNFKLKNDPRLTRFGSFLRKTRIDGLPQLVNVLRNEMSIVGPRMISPSELGKNAQLDVNLLTVKPGLTGLWRVRGHPVVSDEERVRSDMYYIRNWNIWLDIQIIFQTIPLILFQRRVY